MPELPRIYADFLNSSPDGLLWLNCKGTVDDIERLGLRLCSGLEIVVHQDDEIEADAIVVFDPVYSVWLAEIVSELRYLDE